MSIDPAKQIWQNGIFSRLSGRDLVRAGGVCKMWREWTNFEPLWRRIDQAEALSLEGPFSRVSVIQGIRERIANWNRLESTPIGESVRQELSLPQLECSLAAP